MNNLLELIAFVKSQAKDENDLLEKLSVMAEPPEEGFAPKMKLPDMQGIASYNVGQPGVGTAILDREHAEAAPVFGEASNREPSIGELIVGDQNNATG